MRLDGTRQDPRVWVTAKVDVESMREAAANVHGAVARTYALRSSGETVAHRQILDRWTAGSYLHRRCSQSTVAQVLRNRCIRQNDYVVENSNLRAKNIASIQIAAVDFVEEWQGRAALPQHPLDIAHTSRDI